MSALPPKADIRQCARQSSLGEWNEDAPYTPQATTCSHVWMLGSSYVRVRYSANVQRSGGLRQRYVVSRKTLYGLYEVNGLRFFVFVPDHLGSVTTHGITDTRLNARSRRSTFKRVSPGVTGRHSIVRHTDLTNPFGQATASGDRTGPYWFRLVTAELNARGILTPRGRSWHPTSTARLLARLVN
jgi:hypothetical protein